MVGLTRQDAVFTKGYPLHLHDDHHNHHHHHHQSLNICFFNMIIIRSISSLQRVVCPVSPPDNVMTQSTTSVGWTSSSSSVPSSRSRSTRQCDDTIHNYVVAVERYPLVPEIWSNRHHDHHQDKPPSCPEPGSYAHRHWIIESPRQVIIVKSYTQYHPILTNMMWVKLTLQSIFNSE